MMYYADSRFNCQPSKTEPNHLRRASFAEIGKPSNHFAGAYLANGRCLHQSLTLSHTNSYRQHGRSAQQHTRANSHVASYGARYGRSRHQSTRHRNGRTHRHTYTCSHQFRPHAGSRD